LKGAFVLGSFYVLASHHVLNPKPLERGFCFVLILLAWFIIRIL